MLGRRKGNPGFKLLQQGFNRLIHISPWNQTLLSHRGTIQLIMMQHDYTENNPKSGEKFLTSAQYLFKALQFLCNQTCSLSKLPFKNGRPTGLLVFTVVTVTQSIYTVKKKKKKKIYKSSGFDNLFLHKR